MEPLVRMLGASKTFESEGGSVRAVRQASVQILAGQFLAITGPSGCGKSTLLHLLGGMDRPSDGEIWYGDEPLHRMNEKELTGFRRRHVGFVFQFFYLLPSLTVGENVELPLQLQGAEAAPARVFDLLELVGLSGQANRFPNQLSGGEMQRAAVARALVTRPPLLLADEPTGNLDTDNGEIVLGQLRDLERQSRDRLVFHRKGELAAQSRRMLGSFQLNLRILSYLALIVGVILICNTVGLSAISRRTEIATLRTLGTSRRVVFSLFLAEALCFGLAGAVGGVLLAPYLASLAELMVGRTVGEFYGGANIGTAQTGLELEVLILLVLAGVGVALASGARPAWSTTRVAPVEVLRKGSWSARTSRTQLLGLSLAGGGAFLSASLLSLGPPLDGIPLLGYLACLLYILAFALAALPAMHLVLAALRNYVWPVLGVESRLALRQLQGNTSRVSLAVVSLMIAAAMFVGVATMVGSFSTTVQAWINQTFVADLFVRSAGGSPADWSSPLAPEIISRIEEISGIDAVGTFRGASIEWEDVPITLAGSEFRVLQDYGKLLFMEQRPAAEIVASARAGKRVIVSEPFSRRFGLTRGDRIDLKTPSGIRPLEIEAVYYDYSSDRGVVVMDRGLFGHLFGDRSANTLAIYLSPAADSESVSRRIRSALSGIKLVIQPSSDLRASALRVFDRTFAITYGVEFIALMVAALGVMNTLAGLILERRGEFALLRFLGALPGQLRRITLAEATLLGLIGCLFGSVLGQILALVLIYVINLQSFGWTIQFDPPLAFVTGGLLLVFVVTVLAGIYPALLTSRMDALRALRTG